MGYTTDFQGKIKVEPPLSAKEVVFIKAFSDTRRMKRVSSDRPKYQAECKPMPYFVDGAGFMGQDVDSTVVNSNTPPDGQPSLWCGWTASDDGDYIIWNGVEKFYDSADWMKYIIEHFLGMNPLALSELSFLQGHLLNGVIQAQGEQLEDRWSLTVKDSIVTVQEIEIKGQVVICPDCGHNFITGEE